MSELKKLTREEAIVMTENSLNFWKSGNYKDHDEPDIKRNIEYYEMLLNSLRKPRFTAEEREAMKAVLTLSEFGRLEQYRSDLFCDCKAVAVKGHEVATKNIDFVRSMLTASEIADKG